MLNSDGVDQVSGNIVEPGWIGHTCWSRNQAWWRYMEMEMEIMKRCLLIITELEKKKIAVIKLALKREQISCSLQWWKGEGRENSSTRQERVLKEGKLKIKEPSRAREGH